MAIPGPDAVVAGFHFVDMEIGIEQLLVFCNMPAKRRPRFFKFNMKQYTGQGSSRI